VPPAFCGRIVEHVAALPGVLSAGMVNRLPLSGNNKVLPIEFENVEARPPLRAALADPVSSLRAE
jgi:hypothetical protein